MFSALSAFVVATPIFGFVLTLDLPPLEILVPPPDVVADVVDDAAPEDTGAPSDVAGQDADDAFAELSPARVASDDATTSVTPEAPALDIPALMAQRARRARMHRIMGLSTFGAMTATVVLGTLQYANLYGFFDSAANTRCGRGNAFFGQDACVGTPVPHLVTALATAGLYYTTFGLSYGMPDPIGLDRGNSRSARRLRAHKRLRWAHFTGMALQMVLGVVTANAHWFGLDRANDYRAMQGLATFHLLAGYATYGTLTWSGALMAFD